ncbi:MAG: M14 family zinc carboxypeptidase [Phycisphaerales bacterium JB054]
MRRGAQAIGFAAAVLVSQAGAQPVGHETSGPYEGFRVVAVELDSVSDVRAMQAIGADQWSHRVREGEPTDFMVSPGQLAELDRLGLPYAITIEDVQGMIDEERTRLRLGGGTRGWFDDFKDLDAINAQLDAFAASRPDIAETFDVGLTLEGRTMRGLRIANDSFGDGTCKPTILINACQHAREWIAPMVGMYAADRLLAEHGVDQTITDLVNRSEILLVPVANPDGYSYTWTNQRLWRKNRRNNGNGTIGVDLNRNWGVGWGLNNGSSGSGSSEIYRGTAPFSEPETQIIKALAEAQPRLAAQVDLHSYGQLILAPWGYTGDLPPDHATFQQLGGEMQQIIRSVNGRTYTHGPCYTALYPISGGEGDWFWGDRQAHNFLIELRGNNFVLPPQEIIPNAEEVYPALVHFMSWARLERKPRADFNDDAAMNTLDVLAFLNAWGAGDGSADFNDDGSVNTLDVLAFLNEWSAGC